MKYVKTVDEAFEFVKGLMTALEKKAESNIPSVMKLNKITMPSVANTYAANAFKYGSSYYERDPKTIEEVDTKLSQLLEKAEVERLKVVAEHEVNLPAIENNQKVREKISQIMKDIGIPNNYSTSEFKTQRSRTKTTTTHSAGYLGDLQRNVPVSDESERMLTLIKSAVDSLKRHADTLKGTIRKELQEAEKTEKAKKEILAKARLQVKYNLDEDFEWSDVLEVLDKKDKYFMLARAGEETRGYWGEGFGKVEYALDKFEVQTEEDKEIHEEYDSILQDHNNGDCEDGRIFRDCEYNYSFLYGKVSEEIMKDYETLKEYYNGDY
jgi:hypothetical protein